MREAFIIMQIGKPDLDKVCSEAIVPALKACGLDPKRVDKHNEGRLLNSEIAKFIKSSEIIVADLTNERPNCYLEVGYTMGLSKFENLILTAREDHNIDSPNHKKGGPKIHFDLSGYDILWWHPDNIVEFRQTLERKVNFRLSKLPIATVTHPVLKDDEWFSTNHDKAISGFSSHISGNIPGFMEIRMALLNSKLEVPHHELLEVAKKSQIHTFGWPLGFVSEREEQRPRPTTDGIFAEIFSGKGSYDYWAAKRDGRYYLLQNLLEDVKKPGVIWFETRIYRITETFLYSVNFYSGLKQKSDIPIAIRIEHGGLKGKIIENVRFGHHWKEYKSDIGEVSSEVVTSIKEIESNLVDLVGKFAHELFTVFDFYTIDENDLKKIVISYKEGKTVK